MATIAALVESRMKLDDLIEREEAAFEASMAEKRRLLGVLENAVLAHLNDAGLQNVKVAGVGTAFKKKKVSVTVADWDIAWEYILKGRRWDLLNHAVNKTVVEAIIEDTKQVPPGVNYSSVVAVGFQRARKENNATSEE